MIPLVSSKLVFVFLKSSFFKFQIIRFQKTSRLFIAFANSFSLFNDIF